VAGSRVNDKTGNYSTVVKKGLKNCIFCDITLGRNDKTEKEIEKNKED
jgi:hypothetical protein